MVTGLELAGSRGAGAAARGPAGCGMGPDRDAADTEAGEVLAGVATFFSFTVNWSPRLIPNEEIGNSGTKMSGCGG